jgi:hypothetical protein
MAKRNPNRTQEMTRKQAAAFIDEVLKHILHLEEGEVIPPQDLKKLSGGEALFNEANRLRTIAASHGLDVPRKCNGDAHSNPFIDNCGVCMPDWGIVAKHVHIR